MRETIAKQNELNEQLEEARANEGVEVDPKAKGKGKATKSVAEIEAEIQALQALEVDGWILVDFPRTINQAKLLESNMNGYKSLTDVPKSIERSNFEIWAKFADGDTKEGFSEEGQSQPSYFDCVFLLNVSDQECHRRALNNNSSEENIQKLDHNHLQFGENSDFIHRFYNEFGVLDSTAGKGLATFCQV